LPDIQGLINRARYFVRLTLRHYGKTSAIMDFVDSLNEKGSYYGLYRSLEENQGVIGGPKEITLTIVAGLKGALIDSQVEALNRAVNKVYKPTRP
jgi:hypothetical protein